MRIPMLSESVG